MKHGLHLLFSFTLPLCIIGTLAPLTTTVAQQVTPDGTVSTTVTTPDGKNFNINDGTTRGGNLFHSFKEFSVPTGGSAIFNNAANIQNIINRVTGGSVSTIDGLIKANGAANLFLLNPAGIIFGPNARLNIGGSFLGSTANSFLFDNGFEFSATDPQAPPLLTINVPIGLRYRDNPGVIQVKGPGHDINFQAIKNPPRDPVNSSVSGLELESRKTLALVGGKVSVEGGILKSSAGRIEIGSVASNGVVSLAPIQEGWKLGYEGITSFGDINFSGKTFLDTTEVGGGSIAVAGKNINFAGESILLADTLGDRNAGGISIIGDKISVVESEIGSFTFGSGNAGQVKLFADKSILLENNGGASTDTQGLGKGGEITVKADSIEIRNRSGLGSNTFGKGDAGRIEVEANSLLIEEYSGFGTYSKGEGDAGEIIVNIKGPLEVRNNAGMNNNTFATGNAGKISITANSLLIEDNSGFGTTTQPDSTGKAGEIIFNVAGPLVVRNNAGIESNNEGRGDAGEITVSAQSLEISNRAKISTQATGSGNAGNLNVRAKTVILDSNGILQVSSTGSGNAGILNVVADTIKLKNQSSIDATTNSGNGGNLTLDVANFLLLRNSSQISASAGTTGNPGDGGNITINSPLIVAFPNENSDITANAFSGSGGNIKIITQGLFGIAPLSRQELQRRLNTTEFTQLDPKNLITSDITAISQNNPNLSGSVNINILNTDPTRGLFELLETIPDPAQQIAQNPCIKGFGSTFTIVGRGGIPTDPTKILSSDNMRVDLVKPVPSTVSSTSATQKQPSQKPPVKEIIPARGWIFNEKGEVLLVGYDPTKTGPHREPQTPASSCAAR
ncbi:filamentous hemagglutinin N-terminal domain-containing protein [Scytonema tolypothrichoides VB-61278]|nr:filamentous hemagglutinin N-terminal domain-containing protein [Scytonema tolypothrichoides VB-61278]